MKITDIDFIHAPDLCPYGHWWIHVHTDEGVTGLGEITRRGETVLECVRLFQTQVLARHDPRNVEACWNDMFTYASPYGNSGAESRALSALDMALWDILGKWTGQPVWRLLGGKCRDEVPVYLTALGGGTPEEMAACAQRLQEAGWKAAKAGGFRKGGPALFGDDPLPRYLTPADIDAGIAKLRAAREAVGRELEILVDVGSRFDVPTAIRVGRALEEIDPLFFEDCLAPHAAEAWAEVQRAVRVPLCGGERRFHRWDMLELLQRGGVRVLNPDLAWVGGLSELRKIAVLAEGFYVPLAPHDSGAVTTMARVHVMAHVPNTLPMEIQTATPEMGKLMDGWPGITHSALPLPDRPGLGIELRPEVLEANERRKREAGNR
jgi:galactonate dehydratase